MQNVLKQAYQAEVLLRKVQMHSVGTRYPFKDHVVITAENAYRHPENDLFSYTHRIDVVVKCENKFEAIKLNKSLKEYFAKEQMLPLHVGVFQKPYTKDNQKSRKYYAFSTICAKDLISHLDNLAKDKSLKYVVGFTAVESSTLVNGFDLTYQVADFRLEHVFIDDENAKELGLSQAFYKLVLHTSSIIQIDEDTCEEELLNFEIIGESESEIITLAEKLSVLQRDKKEIFTCKGGFPRHERDFYRVKLDDTASNIILRLSLSPDKKVS